MIEIKDNNFWNDLAERGKTDDDLSARLNSLSASYFSSPETEVFKPNSSEVNDIFVVRVNSDLNLVFSEFNGYSEEEIEQRRSNFFQQLTDSLVLTIKKKASCSIAFPAYHLLKFFEAFSSLIDETTLKIQEDKILVKTMDPSRICLIQIVMKNDTYKFFKAGNFSLNLNDLTKVLYCQANDKSDATLLFREKELYITIKSKTHGSEINRTLNALELEAIDIPLDNLVKLEYPFAFSMARPKFEYTLKNSGIYSEIVNIQVSEDKVIFGESGQIGSAEMTWTSKQLEEFDANFNALEERLEKDNDAQKTRAILEKTLETKQGKSGYSLTFFSWIGKMASVLEKDDLVQFYFLPDHPLKTRLAFKKLGNTEMLYFLAPRAEEVECEDDDNDEEEKDE